MTSKTPVTKTIVTERLQLAPVTLEDAESLAVLHADARVMSNLKHGVLDRTQSNAMVARYAAEWLANGFGSWTVRERVTGALIGLGGLRLDEPGVTLRVAFTPETQGKGYGPEFARAVFDFAFDVAKLDRVVAVTRKTNAAGQRALEKAGMTLEREWTNDEGRVLLLYALEKPTAG